MRHFNVNNSLLFTLILTMTLAMLHLPLPTSPHPSQNASPPSGISPSNSICYSSHLSSYCSSSSPLPLFLSKSQRNNQDNKTPKRHKNSYCFKLSSSSSSKSKTRDLIHEEEEAKTGYVILSNDDERVATKGRKDGYVQRRNSRTRHDRKESKQLKMLVKKVMIQMMNQQRKSIKNVSNRKQRVSSSSKTSTGYEVDGGDITWKTVEIIKEFVEDLTGSRLYVVPFTIGITFLAGYMSTFWAHRKYKKKEFLERISFQLTSFVDRQMFFRTLFEKNVCQVMMDNEAVMNVLQEAAKKTTADNPLLYIPQQDHWFIMNCCVNQVSAKVSQNYFAGDICAWDERNVLREWYMIAITCERNLMIKETKIRVIVIREDTLKSLPIDDDEYESNLCTESDFHIIRWHTLKAIHKSFLNGEYKKQKDGSDSTNEHNTTTTTGRHESCDFEVNRRGLLAAIGRLEICIPKFSVGIRKVDSFAMKKRFPEL